MMASPLSPHQGDVVSTSQVAGETDFGLWAT